MFPKTVVSNLARAYRATESGLKPRYTKRALNLPNVRDPEAWRLHQHARPAYGLIPLKGVSFDPSHGRKPFKAAITINHERINLGWFDNPEDAHEAWLKAAQAHYGDVNHG